MKDITHLDKSKVEGFEPLTFIVATTVCCILTFITLIAAAAIDEGADDAGWSIQLLQKLFYVFRFPTHTLLFKFMTGSTFFVGLFINCLFYGFIIERVISLMKRK